MRPHGAVCVVTLSLLMRVVVLFAPALGQVLCFELVSKRNRTWTLHYTKDAVAETDVPETLLELIKQVPTGWAQDSLVWASPRRSLVPLLALPTPADPCNSKHAPWARVGPSLHSWCACHSPLIFPHPDPLLGVPQRRRWLNGALFSLIYYVAKFRFMLSRADHSCFRRLGLVIQFFYQVCTGG